VVRRRPSDPPILPGFSHVRLLGSGGFADVFLYEQNMPRRQVAVKVMLADVVTEHVRQMFQVEANLMAQLSSHPSILTVYQASISADGRPYLVMELCSAQLATRYRVGSIPVAEVLSIGVRIGGAVETAHRQGVLHRDIKPSNIMLTAYGHPVLGDFGIASSLGASAQQESVGMSVPWSAPEVLLDETTGTVQSEVWALAATVYTLLAGRSPFEVVDGSNSSGALIGRIGRARVPTIERNDVPAGLEAVLRRAMSRDPARRPASVLEFVRELQRVEAELGLAATQADITMDDWAIASAEDPSDRTVVRAVSSGPAARRGRRLRRRRPVAADAVAQAPDDSSRAERARRLRPSRLVAAGLLVVAVTVVALGAAATLDALQSTEGELARVSNVEAVQEDGTIVFSWNDPGISEGDAYQVDVRGAATALQRSAEYAVAVASDETVCITVRVVREGRAGAPSDEKCAAP